MEICTRGSQNPKLPSLTHKPGDCPLSSRKSSPGEETRDSNNLKSPGKQQDPWLITILKLTAQCSTSPTIHPQRMSFYHRIPKSYPQTQRVNDCQTFKCSPLHKRDLNQSSREQRRECEQTEVIREAQETLQQGQALGSGSKMRRGTPSSHTGVSAPNSSYSASNLASG